MLQAGMQNDILASLTGLSDDDLVARLKGLVSRDRDLTAQIVAHLAELDTRDVFLREGYGSLFVYCRDALGLSEWEAYNRIEVARAARRFPVILDLLAEGSVNLTAVRLLAPHLTPGNHREVLDSARGKMSGGSSSSTTSIRTLWEARQPSTRSNCGAVATTTTKAGCISASADAESMAGSCGRNQHGTVLAVRHLANLFWNKFGVSSLSGSADRASARSRWRGCTKCRRAATPSARSFS
jgi:hypothetical protein